MLKMNDELKYTDTVAPPEPEAAAPPIKLKVTLEDRPVDIELAQYKRMFAEACADLGSINEALGLDPNAGGAEPILSAISELKAQPEQEPVASIYITPGGEREFDDWRHALPVGRNLLYASPLQRQPLKRATIADAPGFLNLNDKSMWVVGWNECVETHGINGLNASDHNPLTVFAKECAIGAYSANEIPDAARRALRASA